MRTTNTKSAVRRSSGSKIEAILDLLDHTYPASRCTLDYRNPLQLLVATILSAQCTDRRVNQITPALFQRFPDAAGFANADPHELEEAIKSAGLFRNKARNIQACCRQLLADHGGRVPAQQAQLTRLPGIGRKSANVILGNAFGIPGITVDTHVGRISQRLGLTSEKSPVAIEKALMKLIPEARWTRFSHQLIEHGRTLCTARSPQCDHCPLQDLCDTGRNRPSLANTIS